MSRKGRHSAASPSAVTLGETPPDVPTGTRKKTGIRGQQAAKPDWLTFTWKPEPDEHVPATIIGLLDELGLKVHAEGGRGHFGFENGVRLYQLLDDGARHQLGLLDWGGDRMKGRARLDLSGSACARIKNWQHVQDFIGQQWEATITRVDLAVDCLNGEFTVEDARTWLEEGQFTAGEGRPPRHSTPGDWLAETPYYGRTLEIGRRENGKMLRAYEKGLQLAPGSGDKWTRFEVELRNKDRDIPVDVLTRCDEYFAGAYVCLQQLLDTAPERIQTHQKEGELSLETQVHHARNGYGKLVNVLRLSLDADQVLEVLSRPGVPKRLEKATLAGFTAGSLPGLQELRP